MKKSHIFDNLQIKLMLLFFIFALVPLCVLGTFYVKTAEQLILKMATNQIDGVTIDKATLLGRWISERKADLEVMAGSSILRSMDARQIASYLELVRNNYRVYSDISVISRDGTPVYSSSGASSGAQAEPRISPAIPDSLYMSDIDFNPDQNESFFQISAPLLDDANKVEGYIFATVGTNTILSAVLRVSLGETGECYLVNREGKFLAHKEPKRILTENIAQSDSFKNIFNTQRDKIAYIDYRGIEVIGASAKVSGTDWALVVEQDSAEAFQSADRLKKYVYLALVLSTCGALVSAWLLSNYMVGPIRRLSKAADHLAGGEFENVTIQTDRTDEVGSLYRAFGDMARQLQDRQLRLEEKIVLREAELKRTDVRLKETQLAAARSQKLAALGQLAAGVAHEIRTPLTSLKLFLQSVESEIAISMEYEEDFRMAMDQIRRMEATINRFLEFARPQEPLLASIRAERLIEDALLLLKPRAKQQETSIRTVIQEALPEIEGDEEQLGEALLNLLVNALEAIAFRGELTVTAGRDELIERNGRRSCVRIDIKDTGPGIEEDNIIKLFDPFFTTKATGAGLGLSIVYSTVQRHGGEVQVVSNVGRGTTFSVLIPAKASG